jgi:purine nucleosidase
MTVFDQRLRRSWPINMDVASEVDTLEIKEAIIRSIRYAGQKS